MSLNVHVRRCPDHGETNRSAIEALVSGSEFDPRVTIAIGMMRWLLDYQISEIRIIMESRGIRISTGEISNLSVEFLLRFYCIHRRHMKDLELKDYILHLDGTGESGDEIVFVAKEGIVRVTMDASVMPSENSDFITPFLQTMKDVFGSPLAVLRDRYASSTYIAGGFSSPIVRHVMLSSRERNPLVCPPFP